MMFALVSGSPSGRGRCGGLGGLGPRDVRRGLGGGRRRGRRQRCDRGMLERELGEVSRAQDGGSLRGAALRRRAGRRVAAQADDEAHADEGGRGPQRDQPAHMGGRTAAANAASRSPSPAVNPVIRRRDGTRPTPCGSARVRRPCAAGRGPRRGWRRRRSRCAAP